MLNEKVVLITGANGGLGTSVTQAFLDAGAKVVGVSPSIKQSSFPQATFIAIPSEISSGATANALVASSVSRLNRIDVLVHLVGAFAGGTPVQDTDDAAFDRMLDLNLRSTFFMLRAVLPHMRAQRSGHIIAIGSRAAMEPAAMAAAYGASKAALVSLIRSVAAENKDAGISANIVLPATMDTPANRAAMPGADPAKWVQPRQVARLLLGLADDELSQVSGAVIPIYGSEI
jgi:NAD(P)-dependent dehydrogenase (short-subunit alcohol dehydrogenase family)